MDSPVDRDDWRTIGRAIIYALLFVMACAVIGLGVRIFMLVAFG